MQGGWSDYPQQTTTPTGENTPKGGALEKARTEIAVWILCGFCIHILSCL